MGLDGFYSVEELEENLKKIKFALKNLKGNRIKNFTLKTNFKQRKYFYLISKNKVYKI